VSRFLIIGVATLGLGACASPDRLVVTTTSPAKCFYDSNVNQQRCRHDIAMQGHAVNEPRSSRHDVDLQNHPMGFLGVLSDGGQQSQRPSGYTYGYDARFEAGYRTPERFDTTVYQGTEVATPIVVAPPPRVRRRAQRRPVYKD
jgi:hypothetical protein